MGNVDTFPGGILVMVFSWPLTPLWCQSLRVSGGIPQFPCTLLWYVKDNFTFIYLEMVEEFLLLEF